jgi:hypothetical protein
MQFASKVAPDDKGAPHRQRQGMGPMIHRGKQQQGDQHKNQNSREGNHLFFHNSDLSIFFFFDRDRFFRFFFSLSKFVLGGGRNLWMLSRRRGP